MGILALPFRPLQSNISLLSFLLFHSGTGTHRFGLAGAFSVDLLFRYLALPKAFITNLFFLFYLFICKPCNFFFNLFI